MTFNPWVYVGDYRFHEQAKQTCSCPFLVPFLSAISYAGQCQPMSVLVTSEKTQDERINRQQLSYTTYRWARCCCYFLWFVFLCTSLHCNSIVTINSCLYNSTLLDCLLLKNPSVDMLLFREHFPSYTDLQTKNSALLLRRLLTHLQTKKLSSSFNQYKKHLKKI